MGDGISRETFDGMDVDSKLGVLFDYVRDNHTCFIDLRDKMSKRKRFDTVMSGLGGMFGGAATFLGIKWSG